jgi:prephenate dehydrogenase
VERQVKLKKIAVVGLGQIGGSIVLSLRKRKALFHLTGIDVSLKRLKLLKPGLHEISRSWRAAHGADLTIVCLHYRQTHEFLQQASPADLVMDVCSGKSKLMRLANSRHLRFIGGHPLAGNEFAGELGWQDDLFRDAPFFVCPGKYSSRADLRMVQQIIRILGARMQIVDSDQHDRLISKTSHFPAFLSILLKELARQAPEKYQGPGFRSMTRLAATSPELLNTFLESNQTNILRDFKKMQMMLNRFVRFSQKSKIKR